MKASKVPGDRSNKPNAMFPHPKINVRKLTATGHGPKVMKSNSTFGKTRHGHTTKAPKPMGGQVQL